MKIKTQMKITISSAYQVETDFQILGYMGEHNARVINIVHPEVEGADTYRLRFAYRDGTIYDVPIENNQITITASLLREVGIIKCQWLATQITGDTYALVAKSQIFDLNIQPSIGDDVAPIPTYEQAQSMLDQLNEGINSKITAPQVEGKAGQVLVSDGQGGAKWDDVEGVGYDDTEVRELIANNTEAISDNATAIEVLGESKADKSEIPTAMSDLENDCHFVTDEHYTHTDNNYTSAEKEKLQGLSNYDDSAIRDLIDQKATTADIASYINAHKSELKGDDGVSVTNTKVNNNGELVVTLSDDTTINAGHVVGANGADGVSVTNVEKNSAGELVLSFSNGASINVGKVVGEKGDKGDTGADGIGITNATINSSNELVLTYSNGQIANLGIVVGADGKDGKDGADGINITGATVNSSGDLVLSLSNGTTVNAGHVVGANGADGDDYVLTENDKSEIADIAIGNLSDGDERRYPQ